MPSVAIASQVRTMVPPQHARFPSERIMERGPTMRPVLRSSLVLAFVIAGTIGLRQPLFAQNADPAAVAKADAAQTAADAAIAKRVAAEAVVAGEQAKLKTAAQALANANAEELKAPGRRPRREKGGNRKARRCQ